MTPSDLKAGETYVGKGGRRRYLIDVKEAGPLSGYRTGALIAGYQEGDWFKFSPVFVFARWAERKATTDEAAPDAGGGDG